MRNLKVKFVNFIEKSQFLKGMLYGLLGGGIGLFILFLISKNTTLYGNVADWVGAIGTVGAVWLAVSYRRTKTKFSVDAVVRVYTLPFDDSGGFIFKPRFEIDIFNVNDPSIMIKDIKIVKKDGTDISAFLTIDPIVVKGFEAKRINSKRVLYWVSGMDEFNHLKEQKPKLKVVLFGDQEQTFDIRFVNEDGAK